jgi:hypothetical protein
MLQEWKKVLLASFLSSHLAAAGQPVSAIAFKCTLDASAQLHVITEERDQRSDLAATSQAIADASCKNISGGEAYDLQLSFYPY